jgi:serine/threonine-protein kinase RsbT
MAASDIDHGTCVAVSLAAPESIVMARQAGREAARVLGFGLADQTRLATAISEISRNALRYGGGGNCEIASANQNGMCEVTVTVRDKGPGIPDLKKAMTPGFSTGNSLGMGLHASARLMDSLKIESEPGRTQIVMVMRRRCTP